MCLELSERKFMIFSRQKKAAPECGFSDLLTQAAIEPLSLFIAFFSS